MRFNLSSMAVESETNFFEANMTFFNVVLRCKTTISYLDVMILILPHSYWHCTWLSGDCQCVPQLLYKQYSLVLVQYLRWLHYPLWMSFANSSSRSATDRLNANAILFRSTELKGLHPDMVIIILIAMKAMTWCKPEVKLQGSIADSAVKSRDMGEEVKIKRQRHLTLSITMQNHFSLEINGNDVIQRILETTMMVVMVVVMVEDSPSAPQDAGCNWRIYCYSNLLQLSESKDIAPGAAWTSDFLTPNYTKMNLQMRETWSLMRSSELTSDLISERENAASAHSTPYTQRSWPLTTWI